MKDKKIEESLYRLVAVLKMLLITVVIVTIAIVGYGLEINDRVEEIENDNQFLKEQVTRQINATKNLKKEIEELKESKEIYKGDFDVTAYCDCKKCWNEKIGE